MDQELKNRHWYLFLFVFVLVLYLSFLIVKPFLVTMLAAFVLSYFLYPVYKLIKKWIKREDASALVTILLAIIVIVVPLFFGLLSLSEEIYDVFEFLKGTDWSFLNNIFNNPAIISYFHSGFQGFLKFLVDSSASFIGSLLRQILNVFILLFVMFFTLMNGEKLIKRFKEILPLREDYKEKLFEKSKMTLDGFFFGLILVALLQAIAVCILFFVFNLIGLTSIGSIFLFGFLTFLFAVLPLVGPALVWIPVVLIEISKGNVTGGILLTVVCFILLYILLDLIIKPKILGDKSNIHPALVLVGGFGGVFLFGFIGIILGPLILALLELLVDIFLQERYK
ncbi:MAG: AI-2E family transporter [Candidatus Nanoarchaeia archaeon]|nr:AI-2E family transporter [Candidatus Nanoarchaeia archaeon]